MSADVRRVLGLVAALALIAGGCASASSTSTTTSKPAAKTAGSTQPDPPAIPAGSVAVVVGTPITRPAFDHWMYVAAKSQSSQSPGRPAIVPDPPSYKKCIAEVRAQAPSLKKRSAQTLKADCVQLFRSLSSQVMDFLIKSNWIEDDGARLGLVPTEAQVNAALNKAKQAQFRTEAQFRSFLVKTGQTLSDIRFRFKINLIVTRLIAREKGPAKSRQSAVTAREKNLFRAQTRCTPLVVMADCGNYRGG